MTEDMSAKSFLFSLCFLEFLLVVGGATKQVTDEDLRKFSSDLLTSDKNVAQTKYNLQNKYRANSRTVATNPLFETIPADVLKRQTFATFIQLLDNYNRKAEMPEENTPEEDAEVEKFLSAILSTDVMKKVNEFLIETGKLTKRDDFKQLMYNLWFKNYPRYRNVPGSSGFEHVFVGEIKNNEISGLHNWIQYYLLEKAGHVKYQGFFSHLMLQRPVALLKYKFAWDSFSKPTSTMFVGTSPEFEIGLYTVCYFLRPDAKCPIRLGNKTINIQTFHLGHRGSSYIGSAYPTF